MDGTQDVWGIHESDKDVLPMPARQVLLLAIHGWAIETGTPQSGLPALPDRRDYLPVFIQLLHEVGWRNELERLCLIALQEATPDLQSSVRRMCHAPALHSSLVKALAVLAG